MIYLASSIVKIQYSKENTNAVGAGFFITSAGHILTCQHVIDNVDDENEIWVSWIKLTEPVKAEYCKHFSNSSDRMDFAVLKISLSDNPNIKLPPKLDIGGDCNTGDAILGKGFQHSKFDLYPADGKIVADTTRSGYRFWVIRDAVHVDKGISGSPALNTKTNKVIGIFTEQELKKEQLPENGSLAVMDKSAYITPIDEIAKELNKRIILDEELKRFIGKFSIDVETTSKKSLKIYFHPILEDENESIDCFREIFNEVQQDVIIEKHYWNDALDHCKKLIKEFKNSGCSNELHIIQLGSTWIDIVADEIMSSKIESSLSDLKNLSTSEDFCYHFKLKDILFNELLKKYIAFPWFIDIRCFILNKDKIPSKYAEHNCKELLKWLSLSRGHERIINPIGNSNMFGHRLEEFLYKSAPRETSSILLSQIKGAKWVDIIKAYNSECKQNDIYFDNNFLELRNEFYKEKKYLGIYDSMPHLSMAFDNIESYKNKVRILPITDENLEIINAFKGGSVLIMLCGEEAQPEIGKKLIWRLLTSQKLVVSPKSQFIKYFKIPASESLREHWIEFYKKGGFDDIVNTVRLTIDRLKERKLPIVSTDKIEESIRVNLIRALYSWPDIINNNSTSKDFETWIDNYIKINKKAMDEVIALPPIYELLIAAEITNGDKGDLLIKGLKGFFLEYNKKIITKDELTSKLEKSFKIGKKVLEIKDLFLPWERWNTDFY